jgi:hypothetical protein
MNIPAELVVQVTADDIANGTPGSPCQCPIALAAVRALGDDWAGVLKVEEDRELRIALYGNPIDVDPYATFTLPDDALEFVMRFDTAGPVEPFTFTARPSPPEDSEDDA